MPTNLAHADTPSLAELSAGRHALERLLNTYAREVALPEGHLVVSPPHAFTPWPLSFRTLLQRRGGQAFQLHLPHTEVRILAAVEAPSATGNHRFLHPAYVKVPNQAWALLDWPQLAAQLVRELAGRHGLPVNEELLDQIHESVAVTARILNEPRSPSLGGGGWAAYMASEQGLTYGHPFHPAPKSRQGFSLEDLHRFSPELGAAFPLHHFAVRREFLVQDSVADRSCEAILQETAPEPVAEGFARVPVHPWEARYLLGLPAVQEALRQDRIRDLGLQGEPFAATSSVRTLARRDFPYFLKGSLHVRLTNCVRKNAIYELRSALHVTSVLRGLMPELQRRFPAFRVLEEPAFLSVDLGLENAEANREVAEGFGLILREGLQPALEEGLTPVLTAALFGDHGVGQARLARWIPAGGAKATLAWFGAYVELLLPPVLHAYFHHGVVFEPHLQNAVLALRNGLPERIYLRDFEGVKLLPTFHSAASMAHLDARTRQSLWYDDEQGWRRICYCLFVNQLCEAVTQLAPADPDLQRKLWGLVRETLRRYQWEHGHEASAPRIHALLAGQPFPMKANFLNRFLQRPDREFNYLQLFNPLAGGRP